MILYIEAIVLNLVEFCKLYLYKNNMQVRAR